MTTYLIISIIVIFLLLVYFKDYYKGLNGSIFFLVLLPKNLTIDFSINLPSFTAHRIIIILMFIMWVANNDVNRRLRDIPFLRILLLIALSSGISAIISSYLTVSIKRYLYFIFEALIFYVILATSLKKEGAIRPLMKAVLLSLMVVAFLGIIEKFNGFNPTHLLGGKQSYDFESLLNQKDAGVETTYGHRILFGIAMAIGTIYSLFLIDKAKDWKGRVIFWCSVFIAGTALYYSESRGPWLALALASAFIIIFYYGPVAKRLIIIGCLIPLLFLIRPGIVSTLDRLYTSTFQTDTIKGSSYNWRYQVFDMAYTKVSGSDSARNLFFGYGQGSYAYLEFPTVQLSTGFYTTFHSWDNEYAVILLEKGFVGIILILYLYSKILIKGFFYSIRKENAQRDVMLLAMSSMIIFVFMKSNVAIFAPQLNYIEFISIALVSVLLANKNERKPYERLAGEAAMKAI